MQARQKLGEILEGVYYRGDEVVIERAGKPMGVIIPMERYQSIERARERFFATVDRIRESNRDVDPEQVERDIAQAVAEVREERLIDDLMEIAIPFDAASVEMASEDPDDDLHLALAIEAEADYLVSGDHHLLALHSYHRVRIVAPAAFLAIVESDLP